MYLYPTEQGEHLNRPRLDSSPLSFFRIKEPTHKVVYEMNKLTWLSDLPHQLHQLSSSQISRLLAFSGTPTGTSLKLAAADGFFELSHM